MRDRRQARPRLETMESLTLLSGTAALMPNLSTPAEVAPTTNPLAVGEALRGTARGTFRSQLRSAAEVYGTTTPPGTDPPLPVRVDDFAASGRPTPIGAARITGELRVNTGVSSGPPNGTLQLTTKQGTLTLQTPHSIAEPAGFPAPTSRHEIVDTYTITGGTGAYDGLTGTGVVEFTFATGRSAHGIQTGRVGIKFTGLDPTPATI